MPISKATAQWTETLKTGSAMKPAHVAEIPFTAGSRFEGQPASNPEELLGAALAGCFSMALAVALERAGHPSKSVRSAASVKLEKVVDGFAITGIELSTEVEASGLDAAKFEEIAQATKKGCPVSKALAAVGNISLAAKLV